VARQPHVLHHKLAPVPVRILQITGTGLVGLKTENHRTEVEVIAPIEPRERVDGLSQHWAARNRQAKSEVIGCLVNAAHTHFHMLRPLTASGSATGMPPHAARS
jgi:hypothetical protein